VQWLFKRCRENGFVYPGHYTGQYCIHDNAYVDVKPGENCPDCGRPTETVTEENYFFKLSAFQKPLLNWYAQHPEFIQPESRRNEVLSFVEGGLRDLSITRTSIRWGIPVPGEERHVFYVWFDALTAYLSAVGGREYKEQGYWPAHIHLVGKEIIRFHAVYWPAFLMAGGFTPEEMPKQIWAHGWLLMDSTKMSKSLGNVVRPRPIVNVLGMDALRYYLLRETVFGQDGNFSYDALVTRYNADLANGLGNLASRVLTMIEKYCEGKFPAGAAEGVGGAEAPLRSAAVSALREVPELYESLAFSRALEKIWEVVAEADRYITLKKPWELGENPKEKENLGNVLATAVAAVRIAAVLAHPIIPTATQKIWTQLGQSANIEDQRFGQFGWKYLPPGTRIGRIEALFPRIEKAEAIERMETMENEALKQPAPAAASAAASAGITSAAAAPQAAPEKIAIEDFAKVEMRVGEIKTAERIAGADKLLKLTVDIGTEIRQICAGIAQHYEPEKLVGRKVAVVVNLAPRKLRGVESNGMIIAAAVGPEGRPVLAGFLEDVEVGARLK
jgi:methionyl-tRNA synthetase